MSKAGFSGSADATSQEILKVRGNALLPFPHANDLNYFEEDVRHALEVKIGAVPRIRG